MEPISNSPPKRVILLSFFDISEYSEAAKFTICSSGIFLFHIAYGYIQELIFQLEGFKPFGMYLTFVQFICYSFFGYMERLLTDQTDRRIPYKTLILLSVLTVATMGLSNTSVGYLNYPTQVVFKCCKLIPVLLGGILIQGKKYGAVNFLSAGFMSLGLILFTLTDVEISPTFSITGIVLICGALLADACIGNIQEKTMKEYTATTVEVVYYSYLFGCFILFLFLLALSQLIPAFLFCLEHPVKTYGYACIFSVTGYCGVHLVLTLVQTFGAFAAVTVTTFRKALTLGLSFLVFAKPFSIRYVWSALIVVAGIYLNMMAKDDRISKITLSVMKYVKIMREKRTLKSHNLVSSA